MALKQKLLYCIRSEGFLGVCALLLDFVNDPRSVTRTYYVFDELKVIIMGNDYGFLGAFLLEHTTSK